MIGRNGNFCSSTLRAGVKNRVNRALMGSIPFHYIGGIDIHKTYNHLLTCTGTREGISPLTRGGHMPGDSERIPGPEYEK